MMNVFVLCAGRCGSLTFTRACSHISNYSSSHESRCSLLGIERLNYPDNHIEVDNRLSWFLGRLDEEFGDDAFYVHLIRNQKASAESFNRRWNSEISIIRAYSRAILRQKGNELDKCMDYWYTVNANIQLFLKDKTQIMRFDLENAPTDFRRFWQKIGAEGDLDKGLREVEVRHNIS